MNRDTILKHSKAVRLHNSLMPDFTELIVEYCTIKGHSEHTSVVLQLLQQPMIGNEIINLVLEYFEKKYKIIKLEKLNTTNNIFGSIENKQLINIY